MYPQMRKLWVITLCVSSLYSYPTTQQPTESTLFPEYLQQLFSDLSGGKISDDKGLTDTDIETLSKVGNFTTQFLNRTLGELTSLGNTTNNNINRPMSRPPPYQPPYDPHGPTPTPPNYKRESDHDMMGWVDPAYWNKDKPKYDDGKNAALVIGLAVGIPVLIISLVLLALLLFCCFRRNARRPFPLPVPKTSNAYAKYEHSPVLSSADPWELSRVNLTVDYENKLGSGAFCNVFKGKIIGEAPVCQMLPSLRSSKFRDCEVAIKMLPSFADDIARSDFMQEINFMKSLQYHPNLVSMLGWVADRKSPLLLVEFCAHGDLLHYIRDRREEIQKEMDMQSGSCAIRPWQAYMETIQCGNSIIWPTAHKIIFPDKKYTVLKGMNNHSGVRIKEIVSFAWQISNGLQYLKTVGCIHRDIAARNVLVADHNICKIGDFGLCRLTDSLLYTGRGGRLPLKWMAPESLQSFEYSSKSDVWSYGILLWELFSLGDVPFAGVQTTELLDHIKAGNRPPRPHFCTDEVFEVMMQCWSFEPTQRPTFTHICQTFGKVLEIATESYGYLVPTSQQEAQILCDNV